MNISIEHLLLIHAMKEKCLILITAFLVAVQKHIPFFHKRNYGGYFGLI
jgi:hypothetical protein